MDRPIMTDDEAADGTEADDGTFEPPYATERRTAPQGPYTQRDVLVGAVIALLGLALTVGIPLALA